MALLQSQKNECSHSLFLNQIFAKSLRFLLSLGLCYGLLTGISSAEEALEFKVKAAYLYNFTKFVNWPEKSTENFNICLLGKHPFGDLLLSLESKTVLEKPIRLVQLNSAKENVDCHMLYVDELELLPNAKTTNETIAKPLHNSLIISSQPTFAQRGGMIGFITQDGKVKLEINLKVLKQSGLSVSAQLLEVANIVNRGPDE